MPGNVSLSGIEFTIKGSTDSASASLDTLVKKLGELKTSLSKISSATAVVALNRLQKAIEGFNTETIRNVASAFKELGHTFAYMDASSNAISSLASLSSALATLSKNTDKLEEAVSALTQISEVDYSGLQNASDGLKNLATASRAIMKMSENPENIADVAKWLSQIAVIDFTNIGTAAQGIREISSSAKDIANIKPAVPALKETNEEIKKTGEAAKKASSPLKNFLSSIKRIAFYRIIRSIIKSITEAFSEGLKNAYEFSKLTGGALSQALDTISTKSLTMKNQLGAAFGGLLTAVTPIILTVIDIITKLAAAITRLIAILGGSNQWMRAKDVWTEWGEAASGAGAAAKEALRYLAPFDELNRLPSDNKGGGGGGANTPDYANMFEWVGVEEGAGLADALKDAFDKVANFFETKDWAAIADKAWEGLKEAFSDGGKATEVIRSLFEALGAAIGAASAFVGEFCANIAREIHASFKRNLIDYDGDGKISAIELIGALVVTGAELIQEITDWVKTNMVDPFVDGFSKAIGMSGKEELYDAIVNLGIDIANGFINNVINPLKEKWNEFADWIYEKTHGKVDWRVEMTAEIAHVDTAGLTASQKVISGITAGLTAVKDGLTKEQKTIKTTSKWWYVTDGLTKDEKTLKTTSKWWYVKDGLTTDEKTLKTTSRWWYVKDGLTKDEKTLKTTSKWWWTNDGLTDNQKTFKTTSKWWWTQDGLSASQKTISSTAYIADYRVDDNLKYYGYMSVNAYLNIKGQTNTPTVAVNAYYTNQVKARGGAYSGGVWRDIPQYANGGSPHGSMFIAGESGPEIVGHIGGRTEVLNKSQIASAIYSATRSAMSNASMDNGVSEETMYRAFSRALADSDLGGDIELDGNTLYRAMVNRNRANTRLTGVNAMA